LTEYGPDEKSENSDLISSSLKRTLDQTKSTRNYWIMPSRLVCCKNNAHIFIAFL